MYKEELQPSTETDPAFADAPPADGPDAGTEPPIAASTAEPQAAVSEPAVAGEASPAPRRRTRKPAAPQPTAVRMTFNRGREAFPAGDIRAGAYEGDKFYLVPEDVPFEVAQALVDGTGYEFTDRPAAPAEE